MWGLGAHAGASVHVSVRLFSLVTRLSSVEQDCRGVVRTAKDSRSSARARTATENPITHAILHSIRFFFTPGFPVLPIICAMIIAIIPARHRDLRACRPLVSWSSISSQSVWRNTSNQATFLKSTTHTGTRS